ncbi:MAG TPA: CinA family protein [Anaerolineaceae bacterium]|nr:CinA family protein [Anaerolineaceae bacterium]
MDPGLDYQIGELLRRRSWKLATAESCTGGLVSHLITNVPGSSDYFLGGITAYANEAKERLLGVSRATLETYGAVSRETALEMAAGARAAFGAEIGISTSGIAGPGGEMPGKPVGLVWVGMSAPAGQWAWQYLWPGDRIENKTLSAQAALQHLLDYLMEKTMETIQVQARWDPEGRAEPSRFTWNGQEWRVDSTGRRWKDDQGEHILCMTAQGQVFELVYHPLQEIWTLGFHNESRSVA